MKTRISLSLVLFAGCVNIEVGDTVTTATETTETTQATQATSDPTSTTDASQGSPTTTSDGTTASSDPVDSENGGSQGSSQSGTGTGSSTTDPGSTTSDTTGDSSGDATDTGGMTTGECMAKQGPAPLVLGDEDDLGAPLAYAVLAKAAITSVPGTMIVGGNVGVSPAAATAITGFGLVLEPAGVYSTSPTVVAPGKVYAANYNVPTPILLTTAVLAMQAAYTDAASRVPTDYLDLEGGDLGGLTLAPGIYTWGTTVLVPDDVTLEGCEGDVWIFQIAGDLDVSTGKKLLLAGGAQAKNVFWQVAGQATIHANAHFEGVLLAKTAITFQTEASLHGRAYAQTMVAFDQNAVIAP